MDSSITDDTLMKLKGIPFIAYKEWLRRGNQSNGNNSSLSNDNPMKRHVNNHTMVIHIMFIIYLLKFHSLVTKLGLRTDFFKNVGHRRVITPL